MNYSKYQTKAYAKIKQYGSVIKVIRSGGNVYNPKTNEYVKNEETISGYALQSSFKQNNIDGTNIRIGDVYFLAVLDGVPKTNDSVIFGDKSYTVVNVDILSPDGNTNIYYRLQAR